MKVARKEKVFSELKKLCNQEFGFIPKSCIVEAFNRAEFVVDREKYSRQAISAFLKIAISNSSKCQQCVCNQGDNKCYFAVDCFQNDFRHYQKPQKSRSLKE